jgi:hypothetical protein
LHFAICILQWFGASCALAEEPGWDYAPYRIQAIVALDLPGSLAEQVNRELPTYLQHRVDAALSRAWSFNVQLAADELRQRLLAEISDFTDDLPVEIPTHDNDKLLLVTVRWRPEGIQLVAREYDQYVKRWAMPTERQSRQPQRIPEQVFSLLWHSVAPLAQFELDPNNMDRVLLRPRGSALARDKIDPPWTTTGEVFQPFLRRTTRGGELVKDGIQQVPWTCVEVDKQEADKTTARIHSGTRRPFGTRRQGRVEQVAIAIRSKPADTLLRLHSRTQPDKPLIGYEVLFKATAQPDEKPTPIGLTDRDGKLAISPGKSRVRTLYIKHGAQMLARLPIIPGAQRQVDVPLPDDDPRLAAEATLAALREDLIDVVARRNILMARARQKIEDGKFDDAQKIVTLIDALPGRSQFNLAVTTAARRHRSEDPMIQRRIDRLFEGTQTVLSQYLDVGPINDLHDELREARRKLGKL